MTVFQFAFTPTGKRDLKKLPDETRRRILEKIKAYIDTGMPLAFAKPLINLPPATHRFRIGKYRACFYLEAQSIVIDAIEKRGDAYR